MIAVAAIAELLVVSYADYRLLLKVNLLSDIKRRRHTTFCEFIYIFIHQNGGTKKKEIQTCKQTKSSIKTH